MGGRFGCAALIVYILCVRRSGIYLFTSSHMYARTKTTTKKGKEGKMVIADTNHCGHGFTPHDSTFVFCCSFCSSEAGARNVRWKLEVKWRFCPWADSHDQPCAFWVCGPVWSTLLRILVIWHLL